MISLSAQIRNKQEKPKALSKEGKLVGVVYGFKTETFSLKLDLEEFEKVYKEAGESSMIKLNVENQESKSKEILVLIKRVAQDPLTDKPIHVDFYQPRLEEKITAKVPLVFEGESMAVKDLGGTLIKNIQELEVSALPQNLPKEIIVSIESLKTFEDNILIKDLRLSEEVKILKEPDEAVASVSPPREVKEELEKPVEEKIEEVKEAGKVEEERPSVAEVAESKEGKEERGGAEKKTNV